MDGVLTTPVFVVGQNVHDLQLELPHQLADVRISGLHLCRSKGCVPRPHRNREFCACRETLNPVLELIKRNRTGNTDESNVALIPLRYGKPLYLLG